jgi:hypothetical protein
MPFVYPYDNKQRTQYVVRYQENGIWKSKFFNFANSGREAQKKAMAFQNGIRSMPNITNVTRVQVMQN